LDVFQILRENRGRRLVWPISDSLPDSNQALHLWKGNAEMLLKKRKDFAIVLYAVFSLEA